MAHVSYHAGTRGKANKTEVSKQQSHTYRKDEKRYKQHSNKLIDESLTQYNFEKTTDNKSIEELVLDRIEDNYNGKRGLQKNQIVTREAISQLNSDYYDGMSFDEKRETAMNFSEDAYEWYQNEFGEENVLGYAVHLDETNPHTHYTIMPMTDDGRVNQKEFWKGPNDLKRQHREFREHMIDKGWDIQLENVNQGKFIDFEQEIYKENADIINALRDKVNEEITSLKNTDVSQEVYDQLVAEGIEEIKEKNIDVIQQMEAYSEDLDERDINVSNKEQNVTNDELRVNRRILEAESLEQDVFDDRSHLDMERNEVKQREDAVKKREEDMHEKEHMDKVKDKQFIKREYIAKTAITGLIAGDKDLNKYVDPINEAPFVNLKEDMLIKITERAFDNLNSGKRRAATVKPKEYVQQDIQRQQAEDDLDL